MGFGNWKHRCNDVVIYMFPFKFVMVFTNACNCSEALNLNRVGYLKLQFAPFVCKLKPIVNDIALCDSNEVTKYVIKQCSIVVRSEASRKSICKQVTRMYYQSSV